MDLSATQRPNTYAALYHLGERISNRQNRFIRSPERCERSHNQHRTDFLSSRYQAPNQASRSVSSVAGRDRGGTLGSHLPRLARLHQGQAFLGVPASDRRARLVATRVAAPQRISRSRCYHPRRRRVVDSQLGPWLLGPSTNEPPT